MWVIVHRTFLEMVHLSLVHQNNILVINNWLIFLIFLLLNWVVCFGDLFVLISTSETISVLQQVWLSIFFYKLFYLYLFVNCFQGVIIITNITNSYLLYQLTRPPNIQMLNMKLKKVEHSLALSNGKHF